MVRLEYVEWLSRIALGHNRALNTSGRLAENDTTMHFTTQRDRHPIFTWKTLRGKTRGAHKLQLPLREGGITMQVSVGMTSSFITPPTSSYNRKQLFVSLSLSLQCQLLKTVIFGSQGWIDYACPYFISCMCFYTLCVFVRSFCLFSLHVNTFIELEAMCFILKQALTHVPNIMGKWNL